MCRTLAADGMKSMQRSLLMAVVEPAVFKDNTMEGHWGIAALPRKARKGRRFVRWRQAGQLVSVHYCLGFGVPALQDTFTLSRLEKLYTYRRPTHSARLKTDGRVQI